MARKRKIETYQMIEIIDEFFINICKRQSSKLKYSTIAEYMSTVLGKPVKEYEIRRCNEAVIHIKDLCEQATNAVITNIVVFDLLDVEAFISKNNSLPTLKKALVERDQYYAKVCESAASIINKVYVLEHQNKTLRSERNKLQSEKDYIVEEILEERRKNRELSKSIKKMRDILKTNVYPEIANRLLYEDGLLKGGEDIISKEGISAIISDADSITEVIERNKENQYSDNKVIQELFGKI